MAALTRSFSHLIGALNEKIHRFISSFLASLWQADAASIIRVSFPLAYSAVLRVACYPMRLEIIYTQHQQHRRDKRRTYPLIRATR